MSDVYTDTDDLIDNIDDLRVKLEAVEEELNRRYEAAYPDASHETLADLSEAIQQAQAARRSLENADIVVSEIRMILDRLNPDAAASEVEAAEKEAEELLEEAMDLFKDAQEMLDEAVPLGFSIA